MTLSLQLVKLSVYLVNFIVQLFHLYTDYTLQRMQICMCFVQCHVYICHARSHVSKSGVSIFPPFFSLFSLFSLSRPLKPAWRSGERRTRPPNDFGAFWGEKQASDEWWQRGVEQLQTTTYEYTRSNTKELSYHRDSARYGCRSLHPKCIT